MIYICLRKQYACQWYPSLPLGTSSDSSWCFKIHPERSQHHCTSTLCSQSGNHLADEQWDAKSFSLQNGWFVGPMTSSWNFTVGSFCSAPNSQSFPPFPSPHLSAELSHGSIPAPTLGQDTKGHNVPAVPARFLQSVDPWEPNDQLRPYQKWWRLHNHMSVGQT